MSYGHAHAAIAHWKRDWPELEDARAEVARRLAENPPAPTSAVESSPTSTTTETSS